MVKLTLEQTDNILKILKDYKLEVVDMENCPSWVAQPTISEEYFNEKVNEALEDNNG